ncbi:MAG: methyltransferase domain-containing protein [Anaerolineales bacterium]|nr:methyltransferase domain-containing protein [Chloroflexota bacterium]MBL6980160.1 methyltransferase domain-containing protein [Anaerolineales bacterium]
MSNIQENPAETLRLENLWDSDFGDDYVERNQSVGEHRRPFWEIILSEFPSQSVLEIGCNIGANLQWIASLIPPQNVYGIDVNRRALLQIRNRVPDINSLWCPARELPFRDRWFDLTFTMGVLIHQPESTLPLVMSEIVRCSNKYVLCVEYYSEETAEMPYRGQTGALFKRNYLHIYQELFPELELIKQGFLSRDEGWDDVTYWMFEKK